MSELSEQLARTEARLAREREGRQQAERQLALLEAVAAAANQAETVEGAMRVTIEALCTGLGFPLGHLFRVQGDDLISAGLWHDADPDRYQDFRRLTERTEFRRGVGLPGRALETGRPVLVGDVKNDPAFVRLGPGSDLPIAGAFAFPVLVGDEVVAVIEVFAEAVLEPDQSMLDLVGQVGTQLGRVVERDRARQDVAHHAMHDALTGLPNRVLLLDRLRSALARGQRSACQVAVLFIDLDRFKSINDADGHKAGDAVLMETAQRLDGVLRPGDTIARLGGDEFVVLCEDIDDERMAMEIAERFQLQLLRPYTGPHGQEHLVSASIGIALSGDAVGPEALLADADAAMYRAKKRGGGRHELFNEEMRDLLLSRIRIERDLTRALSNNELRLHYQPVVSLTGEAVTGVEALIRWEDPAHGLRSPAEFIPVAEETALILRLGEWVLHAACRQAASWRAELADDAPLPVNVNLAARQVGDEQLCPTGAAAREQSGLDPADLALEVTETALVDDSEVPARNLERLREMGVRVLLDDFGTGYSSLSYLQRFPIDVLKIDRSFIARLGQEDSAEAIVGAIVGMGHALGIQVVAEGIETRTQAGQAADLGCDYGQGFLFARPTPAVDVVTDGKSTPA